MNVIHGNLALVAEVPVSLCTCGICPLHGYEAQAIAKEEEEAEHGTDQLLTLTDAGWFEEEPERPAPVWTPDTGHDYRDVWDYAQGEWA